MHLTVLEVADSLTLYAIIHGIIWLARNVRSRLAKLISTERGRIVQLHSKENHPDTFRECTTGRCSELLDVITIDAATA